MSREGHPSRPLVRSSSVRSCLPLASLALALAALVGGAPIASGEDTTGFSGHERSRLARGELIQRPRAEASTGNWLGGISYQIIDRPIDQVWSAVQDLDAYHAMLPGTEETQDRGVDGDARILYVRQAQMGISAQYSLRMRFDPPERRVEFELDPVRPHDIEDARGFVELHTYRRTRTLVVWAVRATIGMGVLDSMVAGLVEPWVLRVPATMKEYLEGRGRDRYRG